MNYQLKYLTLKEVNEMLDDPMFFSIFGQLMERKKELLEYRKKKSVEKEQELIRQARERGTLIEVEKTEKKDEVKHEIIDYKKEYENCLTYWTEDGKWTFEEFVQMRKEEDEIKEKQNKKKSEIETVKEYLF